MAMGHLPDFPAHFYSEEAKPSILGCFCVNPLDIYVTGCLYYRTGVRYDK
jgi:hypothetical protein